MVGTSTKKRTKTTTGKARRERSVSRSAARSGKNGSKAGGRIAASRKKSSRLSKSEIEAYFAEAADLTDEESKEIFAGFVELVRDALRDGRSVNLPNVGTLSVYMKRAHKYRHPETGEIQKAKKRRYVRLNISTNLLELL